MLLMSGQFNVCDCLMKNVCSLIYRVSRHWPEETGVWQELDVTAAALMMSLQQAIMGL